MTIHSQHPFLPPEGERQPLRRLRGRMPAPVSVWTSAQQGRPVGWTVSSLLVADGEPAEVLGLLDEESDLADALQERRVFAVNLLSWSHRSLADAFAGLAPAPGGPFRMAQWVDTEWGPVLDGAVGWLGARLLPGEPQHAGWSLLVRAQVEHVELAPAATEVLGHVHGRYRSVEL